VTTQGLASNIPKATNELSKTLIPKMKARQGHPLVEGADVGSHADDGKNAQ
jgi:hypothetical protein